MAHVDDQRVARVLDALEAQHPGAQLLVNDPWSIYYLTGFYADMFERFCGVLLARDDEPVILVNALHQLPESIMPALPTTPIPMSWPTPSLARSIRPNRSASTPSCAPDF